MNRLAIARHACNWKRAVGKVPIVNDPNDSATIALYSHLSGYSLMCAIRRTRPNLAPTRTPLWIIGMPIADGGIRWLAGVWLSPSGAESHLFASPSLYPAGAQVMEVEGAASDHMRAIHEGADAIVRQMTEMEMSQIAEMVKQVEP
jgi:hypothetical protein